MSSVTEQAAPSLSTSRRLAMLVIGYVPLFQVIISIALFFTPVPLLHRALAFVAWLYLVPPLCSRMAAVAPGTYTANEPPFLGWWWSQQWQTLFNRLPLLEEVLRILPSVYSLWLRLWGSRIGSLVYWGPGVSIVDRGLIDVGDSVVFGAGVRIGAHLFANDELLIARVKVESRAVVGAYSILAPGVVIGEGESTPAALLLPPHSEWRGEQRVKRRSKNAV